MSVLLAFVIRASEERRTRRKAHLSLWRWCQRSCQRIRAVVQSRWNPHHYCTGGVAERSNAAVLKTAVGASSPWVRIPPPPQAGVEKAALVACAPRPRAERLTLILTLTGVRGHDAPMDRPRGRSGLNRREPLSDGYFDEDVFGWTRAQHRTPVDRERERDARHREVEYEGRGRRTTTRALVGGFTSVSIHESSAARSCSTGSSPPPSSRTRATGRAGTAQSSATACMRNEPP